LLKKSYHDELNNQIVVENDRYHRQRFNREQESLQNTALNNQSTVELNSPPYYLPINPFIHMSNSIPDDTSNDLHESVFKNKHCSLYDMDRNPLSSEFEKLNLSFGIEKDESNSDFYTHNINQSEENKSKFIN